MTDKLTVLKMANNRNGDHLAVTKALGMLQAVRDAFSQQAIFLILEKLKTEYLIGEILQEKQSIQQNHTRKASFSATHGHQHFQKSDLLKKQIPRYIALEDKERILTKEVKEYTRLLNQLIETEAAQ